MGIFALAIVIALVVVTLAVWQTQGARRRLVDSPAARGRRTGTCRGRSPTLNIWAIGESPAVGVGVATLGESVIAQAGDELARLTGRRVRWHVRGRAGLRAAAVTRDQLPGVSDAVPDVMILLLGVSDTLRLCSVAAWRRDLERLLEMIRAQVSPGVPVVLTGVPPLTRLPALKPPLAWIFGLHGMRLNRILRRLAQNRPHVWYLATPGTRREAFASDGLHPGWRGYRDWGRALAGVCCQILAPHFESGYREQWPWYAVTHTAGRDEFR